MPRAAIGTVEWANDRTPPGTLTLSDNVRLFLSAMPVGVADLLSKFVRTKPAFEGSILDFVARPATDLAEAADQKCRDVSSEISEPWLVGHSYRTFAYAVLWALQRKWTLDDDDRELLFVASMLHDIELTGAGSQPDDPCFAVRGGRVARKLAKDCGREEIAAELEQAICVHLNPRVSRKMGRAAQLMAWGTALDFFGVRYHRLPEEAVREVAEWTAHPRLPGLRRQMFCQWKSEQLLAPDCRVTFLTRLPGTRRRALEGSPFTEPVDAP